MNIETQTNCNRFNITKDTIAITSRGDIVIRKKSNVYKITKNLPNGISNLEVIVSTLDEAINASYVLRGGNQIGKKIKWMITVADKTDTKMIETYELFNMIENAQLRAKSKTK